MFQYLSNLLCPVPSPDGFNPEGKYHLINGKALVHVFQGRQYVALFEKQETQIILKIDPGSYFQLGLEQIWADGYWEPDIIRRSIGELPDEAGVFLFRVPDSDWWIGPFYLLNENEENSLETLAEAEEVTVSC